jgi:hypothetical protein
MIFDVSGNDVRGIGGKYPEISESQLVEASRLPRIMNSLEIWRL